MPLRWLNNRRVGYRVLFRQYETDLHAALLWSAPKFLKRFPKHGPAWLLYGIALVEVARYREAIRAYNMSLKACTLNRERHYVYAQLGHCEYKRGRYASALVFYRRAIRMWPEDASGYIFLGACLAKQGRFSAAIQAHRKATCCKLGCLDEAWLNLGLVYRAQERFDLALDCARKALAITPRYKAARELQRDLDYTKRLMRRR